MYSRVMSERESHVLSCDLTRILTWVNCKTGGIGCIIAQMRVTGLCDVSTLTRCPNGPSNTAQMEDEEGESSFSPLRTHTQATLPASSLDHSQYLDSIQKHTTFSCQGDRQQQILDTTTSDNEADEALGSLEKKPPPSSSFKALPKSPPPPTALQPFPRVSTPPPPSPLSPQQGKPHVHPLITMPAAGSSQQQQHVNLSCVPHPPSQILQQQQLSQHHPFPQCPAKKAHSSSEDMFISISSGDSDSDHDNDDNLVFPLLIARSRALMRDSVRQRVAAMGWGVDHEVIDLM
jgi:hypothetical protein